MSESLRDGDGRLEIRLFGQAGANVAGTPLKFAKRATTLAMLAMLILRRGQAVSRDSLAFELFPDVDESAALADLRRYLYLANKSLPERSERPWLIVDAETVRWNDDAGAFVDVVEFERLAAASETQSAALDLYAGDLLEDVYDDWVVAERERLRARYVAVANESLERFRARREYPAAIACAKRILASDPWREDTLRSLVAMRYESGDTAGALAEYERFVKRLRDELAVAPMPETVAVRQSILRNDAIPGSLDVRRTPNDREPGGAISILPFAGRRRELEMLHATWSRAARGSGTFVVLVGEAGVGKTRLAAEVARIAQAEGGRVFVGTTAAPESSPYQPLVEALRSALPLLLTRPPSAARRATLAELLPELRSPEAEPAAVLEQPAERDTARIYDALTSAVRGLASPRPLLLVLEDLHWAGSATIDAIGAVARELTHAPVLLLVTARAEETPVEHPLRALQRSLRPFRNVEEIALERLGEDDVAEIVSHVDGLRDRDAAFARGLYAHSEGNALFLNEAISGAIERTGGSAGDTTRSIADVVADRIGRLGEEARAVAEIAAVAGAGGSVALIREVSNFTTASVSRGVDELLDRRILREASARAREDFVFTHHLIAAAIYDGIEPELRARRHRRIGRVLEAEYRETRATSARDVALHFERGGDPARAAEWYVAAARKAAAVHAYRDAIDLATRALQNAATTDVRFASLDVRERAHGRHGDRVEQRADVDELERLAGDDPQRAFDVAIRRMLLARTLGESDEEGRLIARLETLARALGEDARARALSERAVHLGLRSRQVDALEPARDALAIYERLGDVDAQLACLGLLVELTANVGDLAASRDYLAAMRERSATLADQVVEARALAAAATAALLRNRDRECIELTERALALQIATGDRENEAYSRVRLAAASARLGDFRTALREFDLTLATYESIGHKRGLALTYTNRTMLQMRLGRFDDALASIARSNELLEVVREQRMIACNHVNASFVMLQRGDANAAKSFAQTALAGAREIEFPIFEAAALANLGNAERFLSHFDAAIDHMRAGIAIRRRMQEPRDFVDDLADLTLCYADAGRPDDALATAEELDAIATDSLDGAFWPHYIWWAIAEGFAAGGADDRARSAAVRARSELERFAVLIDDGPTRDAFEAIPVNALISRGSRTARS